MAKPTITPIGTDEYKLRTDRLKKEMAEQNCSAFLITSEDNCRYLTGFRSPAWNNLTRPRYLIIPLAGEPFFISTANYSIIIEETTWIKDIRTWVAPNPEDDGVTLVIDGLRECLKNGGKRVWAELGTQSRLTMPAGDFLRIKAAFPDIEFSDGHGPLMQHRMIKSAGEIDRIKVAAQATSTAFGALTEMVHEGESLYEVTQELKRSILRAGAEDVPYVIGVKGVGGYPCVNLAPDHEPLRRGDIFVIDIAARYDGYYCDFDRDFSVGEPSAEVRQGYRRVWTATEAGIEAVKPGKTLADVWRAMADALDVSAVRSTGIGRMGHSIGLRMCEEPSVSEADQTVIQPGMVLTLEPGVVLKEAMGRKRDRRIIVHEENLVVHDGGAELITLRAPKDIPIVS